MTIEEISAPAARCRYTSGAGCIETLDKVVARRILFYLHLIKSFEQNVIRLKTADCVWGPIHISIGQEAVAAASITALLPGDKITGSHRAHHITLAKILEHELAPRWDPTTTELPASAREAVYRVLAEIMGLSPGLCGGRGGSMHLRSKEAGVLGTNAIVAGGVPLSVGSALAAKRHNTGCVTVAFLGDGAVNQGAFHEACNLAGLWKLPIVFLIENNQYAVATSVREATAAKELVELAAAYEMPAYQVVGYDVPAIHEVMRLCA